MKILIKLYQSLTNSQTIQKLQERMIGWSMESESLIFKEANGTTQGKTKIIPSLTGNGVNKVVTLPGHLYQIGNVVKLNNLGNFTTAVASSARDNDATHYIFDATTDTISVTNAGAWRVGGLLKGAVYLSTTPNQVTQTYTGFEQQIGVYDGEHIHINFNY